MRNCFIPGCDKLCRNEGTTKRKMFVVPKDKETLEAWLKVLPKNRELKAHDKVCERHFNEDDISTTFDNNINGLIYKMERGRPKLKPKAVPSRNMECCNERTQKRKQTIILNEKNKIRVLEMNEENTEIHPSGDLEEQELEIDGEIQDITEIALKDDNVVGYEVTEETSEVNEVQVPTEEQVQELFESLYDDIYEVELPNTLWGVHRCPEHSSIFFSFVDPSLLRTTKMISISSQGDIKILLGNRLMSEQSLMAEVTTLESLTNMINDIDQVLLCSKMFDNGFCEVSLKDSSSEICEPCAQFDHE